ncbi:MAG TPA: two-component regulator propeller domain-containing protein, partial [Chitinispirillaceae bacterium]|nr:two-component regulator propeller domain-containing protein [Chitinispirillaceae bacterium]
MFHILKRDRCAIAVTFFLIMIGNTIIEAGVGESAVITLIFPPGARSTGMGEAFTGLADDATATFYNPAGLGQAPQANSWKAHLSNTDQVFTAIAAKKNKSFVQKSKVWAGTNKGLLRYNGRLWESHDSYLIEESDDLESIAKKYLASDDEILIKNAQWELKRYNKIEMKRFNAINEAIKRVAIQTRSQNPDSIAGSIARKILELGSFERTFNTIFSLISPALDSSNASALAQDIDENLLKIQDKTFSDFTELKVPFSIAVKDSVTSLGMDMSDRIWVGTKNGLWRFDNDEWVRYTMLEGLPSNNITSIAIEEYGKVAAGTDKGLVQYESGQWTLFDSSKGIPDRTIKAVAYGPDNALFIGTDSGMYKYTPNSTTYFDSTTGLISNNIRAIFIDSDKRLWTGGANGISIFNGTVWKRYKFPGSMVSSFAEQDNGVIWIGTDNGVITYKEKAVRENKDGTKNEMAPEWKSFHSKNALVGNVASGLAIHDNDIWITTDKAINQYDQAEKQVFL